MAPQHTPTNARSCRSPSGRADEWAPWMVGRTARRERGWFAVHPGTATLPVVTVAAAVVATIVLVAISVLQIAAARGRPVGRFVWGGQHEVLPDRLRIGSALSVVLYAVMA